jgi:hypothetical protein
MGILSYTYNAAKKALRGKNVAPGQAIKKTQVGTKLAFKRKQQDDFVKFRDNLHKSAGFDTATKNKLKSKQPLPKITKKTSEIFTPKEPKFNKGGRVGLKSGTPKKKKNQGDILGDRFDKKFKKYALSKEAQLHAKDYDEGIDRGERRAYNEVLQEAGLANMVGEQKSKGGRVGKKFGGGMDMGRRKTNVQKIKETFGPKKKNLKPVDKKKNPGLAKLPIEVRNKMGYAKKGGRA